MDVPIVVIITNPIHLQGFYKKAQELLEQSLQLLSEIYQGQERPEMSTTMFTIAQVRHSIDL